jgi:hypothetical protein
MLQRKGNTMTIPTPQQIANGPHAGLGTIPSDYEPTPRPHAAMQCQYAMDDSLFKWIWFELRQEWVTTDNSWASPCTYFVGHTKPTQPPKRMCELGSVSFPEPETVYPDIGTAFWIICVDKTPYESIWDDDREDKKLLAAGLVHLNPEAATLHSKGLAAVNLAAVTGGV